MAGVGAARLECPNKDIYYYAGKKGNEHLVRVKCPEGHILNYEGEMDKEHMVRVKRPNGSIYHYEGEKGKEHMVRVKFSDGSIHHYEGEKGKEHLVRVGKERDRASAVTEASIQAAEAVAAQLLQDEAVMAERVAARDASRKARNSRKRQSKKTRKGSALQPTATTEEARPVVAVSVVAPPPDDLVCPITHELFTHPCFTQDGHTYERDAIEKWLAIHSTSPLTGEPIGSTLVTNFIAQRMCASWKEKHAL